jgi:hypothetical protein
MVAPSTGPAVDPEAANAVTAWAENVDHPGWRQPMRDPARTGMFASGRRAYQGRACMNANDIELGPIDYLIVEWPPGKEPTGEGLDLLVGLTEQGLIRIIDLAFVMKEEDGMVRGLAITDLDSDGTLDLVKFEGASSGVLGQDDFDEAGSALEPGASAAILVYENKWAAPFAAALRRSGAQLVANGRIPVNALLETLDELEAAQA